MLSRVAHTLYWMIRYVERADNLSRLIDVNQQLLLDHEGLDSSRLKGFWRPIVMCTGDDEHFDQLYEAAESQEVIRFLTHDPKNPNSICSCIALARENARTVRDQLADDLWEELNSLYLFTQSKEAIRLMKNDPSIFYQNVRRSVNTFLGIAISTVARDEGWEFMNLGRYLERADKTTRFLDVISFLSEEYQHNNDFMLLHLNAILNSCSAMGVYRSKKSELTLAGTIETLIFSREFPRSALFCIERIDASLHAISGAEIGTSSSSVERKSGAVLAQLRYSLNVEQFEMNLHESLDHLQSELNQIGDELFETYVLMPEKMQERGIIASNRNINMMKEWSNGDMAQQQQQ